MPDNPHNLLQASPIEPTIAAASASSVNLIDERARVHLAAGTEHGLSTQTECTLRVRLRAAAFVFLSGSLAFLIKDLVQSPVEEISERTLIKGHYWMFGFHVAHVAVMGLVAAWLWLRCQRLSLRQLRLAELVIFGWTAVFLLRVQHFSTLYGAIELGTIPSPAGMWLTLIFTYAIFIPNTWRRAAIALGLLVLAPLVWRLVENATFPQIAALAETHGQFSALTLMMLLGYGASVYGTGLIGTLRREVYEARQLGHYRLRHLIGAGGMGEVYLAEHQLLKRPCAIKLIRPSKANDPMALARFEREVRATAKLTHWNTVEVFDYGRADDGTFYYVMEYLPGLSIADLIERYGPMPAERVIYLLRQTCDALREAHSMGLVHRDIKPGNIFAAQRGGVFDVVKLLDFGLAKPISESGQTSLTQDGAITGSPLFMSPEQAMGEQETDARGDIYSLGAVAYTMLAGRPPFVGDKPMKVLTAHARDPVTPPSHFRPDVPNDLEQVILRCLAKQPDDRFQDATSLGRALADCAAAGKWSRERAESWWHETENALAAAS